MSTFIQVQQYGSGDPLLINVDEIAMVRPYAVTRTAVLLRSGLSLQLDHGFENVRAKLPKVAQVSAIRTEGK